jgi:hypothetical protein
MRSKFKYLISRWGLYDNIIEWHSFKVKIEKIHIKEHMDCTVKYVLYKLI